MIPFTIARTSAPTPGRRCFNTCRHGCTPKADAPTPSPSFGRPPSFRTLRKIGRCRPQGLMRSLSVTPVEAAARKVGTTPPVGSEENYSRMGHAPTVPSGDCRGRAVRPSKRTKKVIEYVVCTCQSRGIYRKRRNLANRSGLRWDVEWQFDRRTSAATVTMWSGRQTPPLQYRCHQEGYTLVSSSTSSPGRTRRARAARSPG